MDPGLADIGADQVAVAGRHPQQHPGPATIGLHQAGLDGKCLDVTDNSSADGAAAQIWSCGGSANQTWTRASDGTLRSLGKCLDIIGNTSADGTKTQIWSCTGAANQKWNLPA
ncbi:ricin-type beta-trefoil lectin domain protein [Micromonospora sp. RTGN7]|uniref:ricin-type beta-trefoil lectin domain protein n=1 Tax=Micromonospora sp. RTGN7 TaxID=3016526 RepID=UPI0029FF0FB7|nr:ricin-type beta-trefoil lectin domain protein [Micromonospora sp. RTGN7]